MSWASATAWESRDDGRAVAHGAKQQQQQQKAWGGRRMRRCTSTAQLGSSAEPATSSRATPLSEPAAVPKLPEDEYAADSLSSLLSSEARFVANVSHGQRCRAAGNGQRAILVDWIVSVHGKMAFKRETLFLGVSIFDRFLAQAQAEWFLQQTFLVGISALFTAAKVEEVTLPEIDALLSTSSLEDQYTKQDVFDMEASILCALGWEIGTPTAASFLPFLRAACEVDESFGIGGSSSSTSGSKQASIRNAQAREDLPWYALELVLVHRSFLCLAPSRVAAAALLILSDVQGFDPSAAVAALPPPMLRAAQQRHRAGVLADLLGECGEMRCEMELQELSRELSGCLTTALGSQLQAVRSKYLHSEHLSQAFFRLAPPEPQREAWMDLETFWTAYSQRYDPYNVGVGERYSENSVMQHAPMMPHYGFCPSMHFGQVIAACEGQPAMPQHLFVPPGPPPSFFTGCVGQR